MSVNHYENFPVGSLVLPKKLRKPIHAIYHFARTADDYADEGEQPNEIRLGRLSALESELNLIQKNRLPHSQLMQDLLNNAILPFNLDLQPFYDLLSAFKQDVIKKRYDDFPELLDYCRRSANPVGRLMLALYGATDHHNVLLSDHICTALQLINFWQDIAIDWKKNRIYIPLDELNQFDVTEKQISEGKFNSNFKKLMEYECERTYKMLSTGSPLGDTLKGRIGLELRLIILGGERILYRLNQNQYNVFQQRPVLNIKDWLSILSGAVCKRKIT